MKGIGNFLNDQNKIRILVACGMFSICTCVKIYIFNSTNFTNSTNSSNDLEFLLADMLILK